MGTNTGGSTMYDQVEDTEPKATVTTEAAEAAKKVEETVKEDLAADQTGASST